MTRAERRRAARKLWRSGKFGRKRYNATRRYRRLLWKAQVTLATKADGKVWP